MPDFATPENPFFEERQARLYFEGNEIIIDLRHECPDGSIVIDIPGNDIEGDIAALESIRRVDTMRRLNIMKRGDDDPV